VEVSARVECRTTQANSETANFDLLPHHPSFPPHRLEQRPACLLQAMASNNVTQAVASGDLVDLVSSTGSTTIYPSDDAILAVLQARFRADLPYTRIGATNLVVINPYKTLANVNDLSAKEYEERCYKDTSLPMVNSPKPLQPHLYDLAAKVYLLMRRRNESQAILSRCVLCERTATCSISPSLQRHNRFRKIFKSSFIPQPNP
jgi:Myosin head (motor domain)